MSDSKAFTFAIDVAGQVQAADFEPRNLRRVIESALGEDWKKSPKKLLKSMNRIPDVFVAVYEARQQMIPQYVTHYEALHGKVRELSAQGLKAMELTKDGLPSQDDFEEAASNDIFELYAETRREALRCHRALSMMQRLALNDWVQRMDKPEFKVLSGLLKELTDRQIRKSDSLYCALKDSPQGAATAVLMQASAASLTPLKLHVSVEEDTVSTLVEDRKAFQTWCDEEGFELENNLRTPKPVRESKPQTDKKSVKQKRTETSAVKPAQPSAPKKEPSEADQPKLAVKILKTEAKLATARPKVVEAAQPAASAASDKTENAGNSVDDLADRLVQGLQITPSVVEHRAPGRPRKTAARRSQPATSKPEATAPETISTRPASRNKSGNQRH